MNYFRTLLACSFLIMPLDQAVAEEKLTYFMDHQKAISVTPQTETKFFSKELERDFTTWPIPWEEQVRNAITDIGGSNEPSGKKLVGGKKYWIPFDKIPGEDSFPMMKRLTLSAQRGYQRSVIYSEVELDKMQAEFSAQMKEISDKYRKESEESLQKVVDHGNELKAKIAKDRKKRELEEKREAMFKKECQKFFPDDGGGCNILASAAVYGDVNNVRPLKFSRQGEKPIKGDLYITTPVGRYIARDDQGGWIEWYRYDKETSDYIMMNPVLDY